MLKVHWWRPENGGHNLGDELTSFVLNRFFGVEHQYSPRAEADLISTGSILQWLWDKGELRERQQPVSMVGSGLMHPWLPYNTPVPARIYSVRGYLSRELLGDWIGRQVPLGDPGLLTSALCSAPRQATYRYGIVPHISRAGSSEFGQLFADLPNCRLIDFRSPDIDNVLEQMLSCEIILSQGLHGLILADALGIPNVWINIGSLHRASSFKFYDYFSSIGRPFDAVIDRGPVNQANIDRNVVEVSRRRVRQMQGQVVEAFSAFFEDQGVAYKVPGF